MNLRQLNYFVAIGEAESVTKASARLRIAQPALTRHLKHLEGRLGAPLTRRFGRGIVLTDAGRHLLNRVRPLLDELAEVEAEVMRLAGRETVELSLGLPSALSCFADRFIERVAIVRPDVRLRVVDGWTGFVLDWLKSGQLDLGVVYDDVGGMEELERRRVATEEHYLVVPSIDTLALRSQVDLTEMVDLPMILPSRRHGLRQAMDRALAGLGLSVDPVAEVDPAPTIRALVERGAGYSILSESEVRFHLPATLTAIPIQSPGLARPVCVAYRRGSAAARFAEVCAVIRDEVSRAARQNFSRQ